MCIIVFVVTLEDAVDRRAALVKSLQENAIPYELRFAVDGRNGLAPEHENQIDRVKARENLGRDMADSEFGCALSHHYIYREIIERELKAVVVLEDDAILDPQFPEFLRAFDMTDMDLLMLDHERALVHRSGRRPLTPNRFAYRLAASPCLTTGYLISHKGAQQMVAQSTAISATADWPCDISQMCTYAVHPRLVDHPDAQSGPSDIRADRHPHQRASRRRHRNNIARFFQPKYLAKVYRKTFGKWIS